MGGNKTGTAYRSFDYLEAGADYRSFELAPECDRVAGSPVALDDEQEQRCARLLDELILISLHEHLGVFPADIAETPDMVRTGRMATAFEGLSRSRWDCVFDNLMDGICTIGSASGWKWNDVLHDLGMRLCDIAHQDYVVPCLSTRDIRAAHQDGKLGWVASIEGAAMIENELDRIELLYGFGVRLLGIAYSEANALGSGLREPRDGGLTVFGRQAVERMNKVGMLIDCSHCGDQTTLDVIEWSQQPIVLSHIGARDLWDSNRLAPDAVLEACAAKGGVIGIEAAPHTTLSPQYTSHSIQSVMDHFEPHQRAGRDRSRDFRTGHGLRRPCRAPSRLRRQPFDQTVSCRRRGRVQESVFRAGRVRHWTREPDRRLDESGAGLDRGRLRRRGHRQGHGRQHSAGAGAGVGVTGALPCLR